MTAAVFHNQIMTDPVSGAAMPQRTSMALSTHCAGRLVPMDGVTSARRLGIEERQWLLSHLGPAVSFDVPMARYTSMRIGGPADAVATPESESQLVRLTEWVTRRGIPCMVVGGGTNLLVRDGGLGGVVIRLHRVAAQIQWHVMDASIHITAGTGAPTRSLCSLALRHSWQGMNFALGIPGTVGGAVKMNAGTNLGCMADVVRQMTVLSPDKGMLRLSRDRATWGYRYCDLGPSVDAGAILMAVDIVLTPGDRERMRAEAQRLMKARADRQPLAMASAGSFFKNPSPEIAAGRLIDEAGLKGAQVGRAQISPVHANFLVNLGGATAKDVLQLMDLVQTTIAKHYNIDLVPEVRIVGEGPHT